jgi:hypothetical protein
MKDAWFLLATPISLYDAARARVRAASGAGRRVRHAGRGDGRDSDEQPGPGRIRREVDDFRVRMLRIRHCARSRVNARHAALAAAEARQPIKASPTRSWREVGGRVRPRRALGGVEVKVVPCDCDDAAA